MTLQRQILTSRKTPVYISSNDPDVIAHFSNPTGYADTIIGEINASNFYDYILKDAQDLTILDLGANIGLFSLYASDIARKIYAFEPTPRHYHVLQSLTSQYQNIHTYQIAVGSTNGIIDFYINDENSTMNSLQNMYGTKIPVQSLRLKNILQHIGESSIDFVKCDIEGSEMVALTQATLAPVADKIDCWFVEVHATSTDLFDNKDALKAIFESVGYTVQDDYRPDALFCYKQ